MISQALYLATICLCKVETDIPQLGHRNISNDNIKLYLPNLSDDKQINHSVDFFLISPSIGISD